jgi:hypothetical protein
MMSDAKTAPVCAADPAALDDPEFARFPGKEAPAPPWRQLIDSPGFAILFGIVAPVGCFALKPALVGSNELPGLRFIDLFWIFSYGLMGLEIATLILWLWRGDRLGAWSGLVAGVLAGGGLFAGGLGLVLLPISLMCLLIGIGVLGLMPLLTSLVFFRAAGRAFVRAETSSLGTKAWAASLLGLALVVGLPGAVQSVASLTVRSAIRDVAAGDATAARRIRVWHPFGNCDRLVRAYTAEGDPVRKARLAAAYKEVTGSDVEERAWQLAD